MTARRTSIAARTSRWNPSAAIGGADGWARVPPWKHGLASGGLRGADTRQL